MRGTMAATEMICTRYPNSDLIALNWHCLPETKAAPLKSKAKIALPLFSHTFKTFWWNPPSPESTYCRERDFILLKISHPCPFISSAVYPKSQEGTLQGTPVKLHLFSKHMVIRQISLSLFFNLKFAVTSEDVFPLVTSPMEGILPCTNLYSPARNFPVSENKGKKSQESSFPTPKLKLLQISEYSLWDCTKQIRFPTRPV